MRPSILFALIFSPLVAYAQSSQASGGGGVSVSTSFSASVSFDNNRQLTTVSVAIPITITPTTSASSASASGNSSASASRSASGNSTASSTGSSNSTRSSSTSTGPLPTAPTSVDGGGNGADGAPSPGATAAGGIYGPGDGYISGAMPMQRNAVLVIGTHNGTFHCDEALAVFMLKQTSTYQDAGTDPSATLLPRLDLTYDSAAVKRSRDPKILDSCDIVVDVGAVYDESIKRFDHHQRGFTEVLGHGFSTKLSSAGLIYKHFGREIIASRLQLSLEDPKVTVLWLKMYKEFVEAIDGIDNGVSQYPTDIKPTYRSRTDLSSRVGWLNPAWNQPFDSEAVDAQFAKASKLTGEEFLGRLDYYGKAWLPARDLVAAGLNNRTNIDANGRIIVFDTFVPWKEHLFVLESELGITPENQPFYVLYPDETGGNWRIQAVPVSPESFESRKALPEVWRGVRDDELSRLSGIDGGVFVHASGFIGGNKTKEGALKMAKKALEI
ncbi:hypothetical protein EW146_g4590 [Bondarzewia mesenterica]|uniref:Uncharacterized protein n=1 Tax=Bondarzewia mesenterica TaxID=1095465 RepID=A0A4S4LU27_9AGAM|nr:hypothetical protein EW146_g4590 [Bondarzewia mesenterica]